FTKAYNTLFLILGQWRNYPIEPIEVYIIYPIKKSYQICGFLLGKPIGDHFSTIRLPRNRRHQYRFDKSRTPAVQYLCEFRGIIATFSQNGMAAHAVV